MSPNSSSFLGTSVGWGLLSHSCKLSSLNTQASWVMQPRCEHLKSLIVSGQASKSQCRDLAWPCWKPPLPSGRAMGSIGWYHPALAPPGFCLASSICLTLELLPATLSCCSSFLFSLVFFPYFLGHFHGLWDFKSGNKLRTLHLGGEC